MSNLEILDKRSESGQALFAGVTLLLISSLVVLFFLSLAARTQRQMEKNQAHRAFLLQKANETAQILNEISHNNRMIILALQVVLRAHHESLSLGFALSSTRPAKDNVSFLRDEQGHFSRKEVPTNLVQSVFSAFSKKSERGFFLASGYAQRNKELVKALSEGSNKNLAPLLNVSGSANAFCVAMHLIPRNFAFALPMRNCSVYALNMKLIISYKHEISIWEKKNPELSFGVTIFDWEQKTQNFIRSLILEKTLFSPPNPPDSGVDNLLEKFGLREPRALARETYQPVFAVTHRFLKISGEHCQTSNKNHALLRIEDWSQLALCTVNGAEALNSLFVPAWTPVLIHH